MPHWGHRIILGVTVLAPLQQIVKVVRIRIETFDYWHLLRCTDTVLALILILILNFIFVIKVIILYSIALDL